MFVGPRRPTVDSDVVHAPHHLDSARYRDAVGNSTDMDGDSATGSAGRTLSEVGHYSKTSRGKSGYKKVWVKLSSGLAGNGVTMWAQISGRTDTGNKATWRSDTAGCNSEHCDWDFK